MEKGYTPIQLTDVEKEFLGSSPTGLPGETLWTLPAVVWGSAPVQGVDKNLVGPNKLCFVGEAATSSPTGFTETANTEFPAMFIPATVP